MHKCSYSHIAADMVLLLPFVLCYITKSSFQHGGGSLISLQLLMSFEDCVLLNKESILPSNKPNTPPAKR